MVGHIDFVIDIIYFVLVNIYLCWFWIFFIKK